MENGKHKMPDGHMMSDKEMEKMEKEKHGKKEAKAMKKKRKKMMTSDGMMMK